MKTIVIRLKGGREVSFEVSTQPDQVAYFVLGVRKSGSSVLNSICESLCRFNRKQYVDIAGRFFEENVSVPSWINDIDLQRVLQTGNLYGGFREMPFSLYETDIFKSGLKVLMVRDPRDALVSEFFSSAYTHSIPSAKEEKSDVTLQMLEMRKNALNAGLEQFVLNMASSMNNTLMEYAPLISDNRCLILKYEDMIFDKKMLMQAVCHHFRWTLTEELISRILKWADIIPAEEDPKRFVRRVKPGDHRDKLSLPTIARLDQVLTPSMKAFCYSKS